MHNKEKEELVDAITGWSLPQIINLRGDEFQCPKCEVIHKKSPYCMAQQAMGNEMTFKCDCGTLILL